MPFVVLIGKHFQNSFHHAVSVDNQGFETMFEKNVRHYQEQTDIFQCAVQLM